MMRKKILVVLLSLVVLGFALPCLADTVTYEYDNLYRLIKATYADGTVIEYTYDAAGNRLSVVKENPQPQTLILLPTAAGDETNIATQTPAGGSHWEKLDDPPGSPDDAGTTVGTTSASYQRDLYALTDPGVSGTIHWIKVWIRCQSYAAIKYARTAIKTGGIVYDGPEITLSWSWANYSTEYTTNPQTGLAWTWSDINALQAGVSLHTNTGLVAYCTQVYVEVNYTPSSQSLPQVSISADPASIDYGESSTLTWSSSDADYCEILPEVGGGNPLPTSGTETVSPTETTTYTIAATGPGGTVTDNVTVTVTNPPQPQTLILLPTAVGDETNIATQTPAGGSHWEKLDDPPGSPDDAGTTVGTTSASYQRDLYALTDPGVSGTIHWIKVWIRCQSYAAIKYARTAIKTGGIVYDGPEITLSYSWTNYSTQYSTNPQTGLAWTWSDIDALQAGVSLHTNTGLVAYCTQVYVEVNYTPTP